MKKIKAVFLAMVIAVSLTSCQPAPKKPIVVNVDTNKVVDKATEPSAAGTALSSLGVSKTFTADLKDANGTLTVKAEAPVVLPSVNYLPTVRVGKGKFTQDTIDKLLQVLVNNAPLYDTKAIYAITQSEIEAQLLKQKQSLQTASQEDKVEIQASIDKLQEAYKTAPENKNLQPISKKMGTIENSVSRMADARGVIGITDASDGRHQYFAAYNSPQENIYQVHYTCESCGYSMGAPSFYYYENNTSRLQKLGFDPQEFERKLPAQKKTAEQAKAIADDVVQKLGLQDMECVLNEEVIGFSQTYSVAGSGEVMRRAYTLQYQRKVDGCPLTYTWEDVVKGVDPIPGQTDDPKSFHYNNAWHYECLSFIIDDSGIVEFNWESPYEIKETETKQSELLPFSDIQDIFNTMILVKNAQNNATSEMNISKVQLGLMRITEKNSSDSALLVPVWDFFGTVHCKYDNGGTYQDNDLTVSRLTINAIDGTIINRIQGY